jgi:hypothetical protein
MGEKVKFKNFKKKNGNREIDGFAICITEEEFMHCPHCDLKYGSENHDCCPVCKRSTRDIININRKYSDALERYRLKVVGEFREEMKERYEKKQRQLKIEYGLK